MQDRVAWMYCCNGKYAVKSRYQVARMLAEGAIGKEESSEQREDHQVWTQLWKLRVPNKIKIFGWWACLNILPSKVNLAQRQILTEDRCGGVPMMSRNCDTCNMGLQCHSGCLGWV